MSTANPEPGRRVRTGSVESNVLDAGQGDPLVFIHGSGPGVSAWANWRLAIPVLAQARRVIAPDKLGFGTTERPAGIRYDMDTWVQQALDLLRVDLVGNFLAEAAADEPRPLEPQ